MQAGVSDKVCCKLMTEIESRLGKSLKRYLYNIYYPERFISNFLSIKISFFRAHRFVSDVILDCYV